MNFFPILKSSDLVGSYPILTLKNAVVFPETVRPLFFNRPQSLRALEEAMQKNRDVFVVTLKNPDSEKIVREDLYDLGVIGKITRVHQLPNGSMQAIFEAEGRAKLLEARFEGSFFEGRVEKLPAPEGALPELSALVEALKNEFLRYLEQEKDLNMFQWFGGLDHPNLAPGKLADAIASLVKAPVEAQQELLGIMDVKTRLEKVYELVLKSNQQKDFEKDLKTRVEEQIGKKQREYFLHEQMKAIQQEIGQSPESLETEELAKKIAEAALPAKVKEVAEKELGKLKLMGNNSHEATPIRNYLDWLLSLPWTQRSADNLTLSHAEDILNEDHYGMEKVKERILEYIAVANVVGKLNGPILCLSGPPGVGKTSLAQSIAKALGRSFARVSLGGVRDEAEVRGHRRTYVGALPGKLIQTMKKVGTVNPVILLDEIDKVTQHYIGGPTAALLEVLDPEQNNKFVDHYLEVEYDLSQVLFICTANNLADIPLPLMDRLEVIELSGYTELEKAQIVQRHLLPKQMEKNGVKPGQMLWEEGDLLHVIRSYTREAGVRSLERVFAKLCRKAVTELLKQPEVAPIRLEASKVQAYLGAPPFEYNQIEARNEVGMITGLAWTSVGGETLSIEATTMKGHGKIQLTGKLGDVMKESAQAALSYVRAHANSLGIYAKVFETLDIHVHVPAGGTPKDGPSAGIALTTVIVSALTQIPILRDVALTGEVTLRGKVLPIGGLKEKLLAAKRAQIQRVLIPQGNQKDLAEIPAEILEGLDVRPVRHVEEVFPLLLERLPVAVSDEDLAKQEAQSADSARFGFGSLPLMPERSSSGQHLSDF